MGKIVRLDKLLISVIRGCLCNKFMSTFSPRISAGVHFRGESQHVGYVSGQKFKYKPNTTLEITDTRLLHELYDNAMNSCDMMASLESKLLA